MNLDRLIDDWRALKRRIRKHWNKLTEEDLASLDADAGIGGLAGVLQERYGISKKQAQHDLEAFGAEVGTTFKEAASFMGDAARGVWRQGRERVKETVGTGRERARELFENGREHLDDYMKKTEEVVRNKPIASLAVAAGIGALVVLLVRWRR